MTDFRPADHAMGLELQLEELQEQQKRALVQGRVDDAARLASEIEQLQGELGATAELLSVEDGQVVPPHLHDAGKLSLTATDG
jgi:quercetin dioxygenase-like cupin family protein